MGMSIDEAIKQIIECKAYKQCDTEKDSEAFEFAVDTMRKYQKIEELVEYHLLRVLPKDKMSDFQKDILEVVEDGNDKQRMS